MILLGLLKVTLLAIYRRWARNEKRRLDGPPRGGEGGSNSNDADGRPSPNIMTREDIEELIGNGSKRF